MKRTMAAVAAAGLALGSVVWGAGAASAGATPLETLTGDGCQRVDYIGPAGTTVSLQFGPGCEIDSFGVVAGSPDVTVSGGGQLALVWHQSVGRESAEATCPEGWSGSWAQWRNEGTGGFTCQRDVAWGKQALKVTGLTVVLNTDADWVDVDWSTADDASDQWIATCQVYNGPEHARFWPDVVGDCLE